MGTSRSQDLRQQDGRRVGAQLQPAARPMTPVKRQPAAACLPMLSHKHAAIILCRPLLALPRGCAISLGSRHGRSPVQHAQGRHMRAQGLHRRHRHFCGREAPRSPRGAACAAARSPSCQLAPSIAHICASQDGMLVSPLQRCVSTSTDGPTPGGKTVGSGMIRPGPGSRSSGGPSPTLQQQPSPCRQVVMVPLTSTNGLNPSQQVAAARTAEHSHSSAPRSRQPATWYRTSGSTASRSPRLAWLGLPAPGCRREGRCPCDPSPCPQT